LQIGIRPFLFLVKDQFGSHVAQKTSGWMVWCGFRDARD
jgi:hypothetical protein